MNVCTTVHDNSFNSRRDISMKNTNVKLVVAQEEKARGPAAHMAKKNSKLLKWNRSIFINNNWRKNRRLAWK